MKDSATYVYIHLVYYNDNLNNFLNLTILVICNDMNPLSLWQKATNSHWYRCRLGGLSSGVDGAISRNEDLIGSLVTLCIREDVTKLLKGEKVWALL